MRSYQEEAAEEQAVYEYLNRALAMRAGMSAEMAAEGAGFARFYPTNSGELAVAIAVSGQKWDAPMMSEIAARESDKGNPFIGADYIISS